VVLATQEEEEEEVLILVKPTGFRLSMWSPSQTRSITVECKVLCTGHHCQLFLSIGADRPTDSSMIIPLVTGRDVVFGLGAGLSLRTKLWYWSWPRPRRSTTC